MLKLLPILLLLGYGLLVWWFSARRSRAELDARSVPLDEPGLRRVADRLAAALGVPSVPVRIYEIDAVNGLAAPDGRVFLTRGFVERYRRGQVTAEELASVIAHELGHVAFGHTRRRLIDFTGQNAIRLALGAMLGRVLPGFGVWIADALAALVAARLSRQDEYEADAYAAALLVKAGIGTGPQKALLARLGGLTGGAGEGVPAWFLSHPKPADRIAAIERLEARWGLGPGGRTPRLPASG